MMDIYYLRNLVWLGYWHQEIIARQMFPRNFYGDMGFIQIDNDIQNYLDGWRITAKLVFVRYY